MTIEFDRYAEEYDTAISEGLSNWEWTRSILRVDVSRRWQSVLRDGKTDLRKRPSTTVTALGRPHCFYSTSIGAETG